MLVNSIKLLSTSQIMKSLKYPMFGKFYLSARDLYQLKLSFGYYLMFVAFCLFVTVDLRNI